MNTYNPIQGMPPNQSADSAPLGGLKEGEQVICEIRRHPFGLFGVYVGTALIVVAALAAAVLVPTMLPDISSQAKLGIVLAALLTTVISLLVAYIGTTIYNANRWVVTNNSITEYTQTGLFDKQESQLSLANLEDVTYEKDGLMDTMLGFGTLHVETAGEHSKFVFPFCPDPAGCAKMIINAHESYIATKPQETLTANRTLTNAQTLNQTGADNQPQGPAPSV